MSPLKTTILILAALGAAAEQPFQSSSAGCTLIDMSYDLSNETLVWPTARKFEIQNRIAEKNSKGIWMAIENFCSPEHGGTHLDAPFHFSSSGWTVDQIPVQRLLATAAVINIAEEAASNTDAQVTVEHLAEWEEVNGRLPDDSVLIMYSGWGRHWRNTSAYFGNDVGDETKFHFPGFHPDAARWLIANRRIVGVGVDTASVDFGATPDFEAHTFLAEQNIYVLENVAEVDKLPPVGARLIIMPIKIRSGTGGPCRIVAQLCTAASGSAGFRFAAGPMVALLVSLFQFLISRLF